MIGVEIAWTAKDLLDSSVIEGGAMHPVQSGADQCSRYQNLHG